MNQRSVLLAGIALGFLGVALGAFGAHALRPLLEANGRTDTFELAVRYQFFHALALLFTGLWMQQQANTTTIARSALFHLLGVVLFSGSLYVLSLTGLTAVAWLTPIGGLFLLLGWAMLGYGLLKSTR
jgi:uncharacterized membrane protein YgdD (TMEM256/DUF423 family)